MLPQIRVASPCTADWDRMAGNNRVRHCAQCNLNVYNFSEMTSGEVEQLIAASKGQRLCGRLYRRSDGTILTSDCPIGVRARIRRVSRRVGAALSAAMSVSLAAAQSPQHEPSSLVQIQQAETGIHLVVFDESRAVIPKAQVIVADRTGKQIAEGITDANGKIRLPHLAPDTYSLTIQSPGFQPLRITVTVAPSQVVEVAVALQVAALMGVVVEVVSPEMPTQSFSSFRLIPENVPPSAHAPESNAPPHAPAAQPKNPLKKLFRALGHALNS